MNPLVWYWLHVAVPMLGFAAIVTFSLVTAVFAVLANRFVIEWWRRQEGK